MRAALLLLMTLLALTCCSRSRVEDTRYEPNAIHVIHRHIFCPRGWDTYHRMFVEKDGSRRDACVWIPPAWDQSFVTDVLYPGEEEHFDFTAVAQ